MGIREFNILLADDDPDDCTFFKEALEGLPVKTKLSTVHDGVELMRRLSGSSPDLPDALYLDLNMPRKNGFECLSEISGNKELRRLPVIIFSTSFDKTSANALHERGAHYYICKPGEFQDLRKIILLSIDLISKHAGKQPAKENFVLTLTDSAT